MKSGIYKITNTVNGRVYIGRAKQIQARWKRHQRELAQAKHHNQELQADWISYDPSAFFFEVIEHCEDDLILLSEREAFWMRAYEAFTKGYNRLTDKNDFSGLKHSDSTKQKMSQIRKDWYQKNPEHKKTLSELRKAEWKSGSREGQNSNKSPEVCAAISVRMKEKAKHEVIFSDEARAKALEIRRANPDSMKTKLKQVDLDCIKMLWAERLSTERPMQFCRRLAEKYSVHMSTIKRIVYNRY